MKRFLFCVLLSAVVLPLLAEDSHPTTIWEYEKQPFSKKQLTYVTYITYNDSMDVVESRTYKMFPWAEDSTLVSLEKYTYNSDGHLTWALTQKREVTIEDTGWVSHEDFPVFDKSGKRLGQRSIHLEGNDSSIILYNGKCNILSYNTYDRISGRLAEAQDYQYSTDSLDCRITVHSYLPDGRESLSYAHETYDEQGDEIYYEDSTYKSVCRNKYFNDTILIHSHVKEYEKRHGHWHRSGYDIVRFSKDNQHCALVEHGGSPGQAYVSRYRYNQFGDLIRQHVVSGLGYIFPVTYTATYRYQ